MRVPCSFFSLRRRSRRACVGLVLVALGACTPTLDWREIRPADSGLTLLFPCKPASHAREIRLDGAPRRMTLYACEAAGVTFALSHLAVSEVGEVRPAMEALRAAAAANLQAAAPASQAFAVPGGTPNGAAGRLDANGRLPGGEAGRLAAVFFVRDTRLFQATVFGRQLDPEAVDTFFAGLKLAG